jgi:hypothetical protein
MLNDTFKITETVQLIIVIIKPPLFKKLIQHQIKLHTFSSNRKI